LNSEISIATYNTGLIRAQLAGFTLFEFAPHVEIRSKYISSTVLSAQPDIICFQEIFSGSHLRKIAESLTPTHPYRYAPKSLRPKIFGSGLALFSRYPILQCNGSWFKSQLLEESLFAPKGYLSVTLDTGNNGLLEVINSHTTAGGSKHHPESSIADRCRQLQLDEMVEFSQQRDASVVHSLIVGDLNCGPEASRANYESILSCGFTDLIVAADPNGRAPVTWDPKNPLNIESPHKTSPPQRIDHVLANSRSTLLVGNYKLIGTESTVELSTESRCTPSDHYGVVVSLRSET
jgi:endonuclease/exonuclease/phosphatase family metal-dependent hydrolase